MSTEQALHTLHVIIIRTTLTTQGGAPLGPGTSWPSSRHAAPGTAREGFPCGTNHYTDSLEDSFRIFVIFFFFSLILNPYLFLAPDLFLEEVEIWKQAASFLTLGFLDLLPTFPQTQPTSTTSHTSSLPLKGGHQDLCPALEVGGGDGGGDLEHRH